MGGKRVLSIGVTGTPGCGKTTLVKSLKFPIVGVNDLAIELDCVSHIEGDETSVIDVEMMAKLFVQPIDLTLYDGHLSHYLPVDAIIVMRCNPSEIAKRLESRGYSEKKIRDNCEVELMGGPWNDLCSDERPICEIRSPQQGFEEAIDWINSGCPPHTTPETALDWISRE
ncbi:MAG: AAA family ATPase [Candidatus Poseidoniaceae archaeon]|jgi:adenylate kinase|nr:AAA family ATPase [Candidatus Poseidoniaceae archaeon]